MNMDGNTFIALLQSRESRSTALDKKRLFHSSS